MRYVCILLLVASTAIAAEVAKLQPPNDAELVRSRGVIEEVYGDQIKAARTTTEKSALAQELIETAKDTENPWDYYAILDQAKELATSAKNLGLAFRAIDMMAERFNVDVVELKAEISDDSDKAMKVFRYLETLDRLVQAKPEKTLPAADECYDVAQSFKGAIQKAAKERAVKYYEAILPKLKGLQRKKVEQRLAELKRPDKHARKASRRQSNKNADLAFLSGKWQFYSVGANRKHMWTFGNGVVFRDDMKLYGDLKSTDDSVIIFWRNKAVDRLRRPIDERGTVGDSEKFGPAIFVIRKTGKQ